MEWDEAYRDEARRDEAQPLARARGGSAEVVRLWPLRVLVVSADEPFRAVNAMLIARRGCQVFSLAEPFGAAELSARERIDVVLADGRACLRVLTDELAGIAPAVSPVGLVLVGEADEAGPASASALVGQLEPDRPLQSPAALEKWTPFDDLFAAIVRADRGRVRARVLEVGWPPGVRRPEFD